MERVQFQQEQMLAELKDLAEKKLFTQAEIKQIMRKRTQFETVLVRRIPRKADFLRYAAYEMRLETLRKKRLERIKVPKGPPTISDFALLRRQYQIFERALRKFKDDLSLWLSYIRLASSAGSRALVGRLCARATTLHPTCPLLYILGANHELRYGGYSASRTLLQRGVRMNPESVDLWREMVRLELGFVNVVRKRWEVLGLATGMEYDGEDFSRVKEDAAIQDGSVKMVDDDADDDEKARRAVLGGALVETVISNAVKENPSIELFKALHTTLSSSDTPCHPSVRRSLIAHLHSHLHTHFFSAPSSITRSWNNGKGKENAESQAALLYATRFLTPDLEGEALVDALRAANEDLIKAFRSAAELAKNTPKTDLNGLGTAYAQFVCEWFEKVGLDENLKLYLLGSLQSLCTRCSKGALAPASLLKAHLTLLSSASHPFPPPFQKLLKFARKYTSYASHSADLWLVRLEIEGKRTGEGEWKKTWDEARKALIDYGGDDESRRIAVWTWGLDNATTQPISEQIKTLEVLLKESMRASPSSSGTNKLSDTLLIRYFQLLYERSLVSLRSSDDTHGSKENIMAGDVHRVVRLYTPSTYVWDVASDIYTGVYPYDEEPTTSSEWLAVVKYDFPNSNEEDLHLEERTAALHAIFDRWRLVSPIEHGKAALKWAAWLLAMQRRLRNSPSSRDTTERGRKTLDESGKDAARVIANARTALAGLGDNNELDLFESTWRRIVDRPDDDGEEEGIRGGDIVMDI